MNTHNCHCRDEFRGHLSDSLTDQHRIAWRDALAKLASPMVRLHQLRNMRTQMLHDALDDLDSGNERGGDA